MKFAELGKIAGQAWHKEPDELNDTERLAIAIAAGCEWEFVWDDQVPVLRTRYPVGLQKVDGQWRLAEYRGQRATDN